MSEPAPPPPPLDQSEWDSAATQWAVGSLDRIRSSAEKWVGTVSTLVGVFGTVVIFAGPTAFSELQPPAARYAVFILLAVASLAAGAAILLGALAAQGSSKLVDNWGGATFASYTLTQGNAAAVKLVWSRWLGSIAAAIVLAAGLAGVFLGLGDKPSAPTSVIVITDHGAYCGALVTDADGSTTVAGKNLDHVVQILEVSRCNP
jgi:hypothetical protein